MDTRTTALERAFELARSGSANSVENLKRSLRVEGYADHQITGRTLLAQLRLLIHDARDRQQQL